MYVNTFRLAPIFPFFAYVAAKCRWFLHTFCWYVTAWQLQLISVRDRFAVLSLWYLPIWNYAATVEQWTNKSDQPKRILPLLMCIRNMNTPTSLLSIHYSLNSTAVFLGFFDTRKSIYQMKFPLQFETLWKILRFNLVVSVQFFI